MSGRVDAHTWEARDGELSPPPEGKEGAALGAQVALQGHCCGVFGLSGLGRDGQMPSGKEEMGGQGEVRLEMSGPAQAKRWRRSADTQYFPQRWPLTCQ